jgi:hypothetical protein
MNANGIRYQASGNRQGVDDLLNELGRALDVKPSSDFGARVQARIHATPPASSMWSWRWGFAAGALVTVVILTVVTRVNSELPGSPARESQSKTTVAVPRGESTSSLPHDAAPVRRSLHPRARTTVTPAIALHEPQLLIAPDQAAAVRHLLDRFARGSVPPPRVTEIGAQPTSLEIIELAPIPMIVISPLTVPADAGGTGSRK